MEANGASGWLRLQSGVVLPAARSVLLVSALVCFLVVVGGLCATAFFEFLVVRPASEVAVPAPYERPQSAAIDMSVVDSRFVPPKNIRFEPNPGAIEKPLTTQDVLGRLQADTPNAMATVPDDFAIVGGKDAGLFGRAGYGLTPTQALVDKVNGALPKLTKPEHLTASIKVVARDAYGNASAPTDVAVNLTYGATPAPPEPPKPVAAAVPQLSPLQRIAHGIALIVDPEKTPRYFDEYERAMGIPARCSAGQTNAFIGNYGRAFEREKAKITAANVEAFYVGVCDAWAKVVADQEAQRASIEAARNRAFAENAASRTGTAIEAIAAWASRNVALIVTGVALAAFLLVALLLAFLAMENHSKALRDAVQALVSMEVARNNQST